MNAEKTLKTYLDNPNNKGPINKQIILIGQEKVGKSAIITKFIKGKFRMRYRPTYDIEFYNKANYKVHNKPINLQLVDTVSEDSFLQNNTQVLKTADAILFVYDQSNQGSLQSLTDYWLQEVNRIAKPNCVKGILANKSDYFLKSYNKYSLKIGPIDSDDEDDNIGNEFNVEEQLLSEIGKYVTDEQSLYLENEDEDDDQSKTIKLTDDVQKKYGIRVFETSALLGTGLDEVFEFITKELLIQQMMPKEPSYASKRAQTTLDIDKNFIEKGSRHLDSVSSARLVKQIQDRESLKKSSFKEKDGFVDLASSVQTCDPHKQERLLSSPSPHNPLMQSHQSPSPFRHAPASPLFDGKYEMQTDYDYTRQSTLKGARPKHKGGMSQRRRMRNKEDAMKEQEACMSGCHANAKCTIF